jgi:D-lactate dehydrogenase
MTPCPTGDRPSVVGPRTSERLSDRLRYAHDASHYHLVPAAVALPRDPGEVAALLRRAAAAGLGVTFRSGGTSLSGQAVTAGVLADVRRHFQQLEVTEKGHRVTVGPGVVLRRVNAALAPYGRRLGPDPASESACTVGGVVANNSSGMTCGTELNAYRTLESVVAVLASGTVLDTGAPDADERFRAVQPDVHAGLLRMRDRVRDDPASVRILREQFAMKNTMGYGLNAFLDHDDPARILTHLLVGSEGTLAFVARATFRTVPVRPHAATGLLVFADLRTATRVLPELLGAGPAAVELLDADSLRLAQRDSRAVERLRRLAVTDHAALLVEWQQSSEQALEHDLAEAGPALESLPVEAPVALGRTPGERAALWHVRKGLYATVAAARPPGTTALLEDVAVPVGALADTCSELTRLVARHGYDRTVIFGHARDGNVHFMLTERFADLVAVERYQAFTEDLVDLILGRGGTLKAEHGTGRVMAPFVRRQYGDELYDVMVELKRLLDPGGVLAPGVVIDSDPNAHLQHLKVLPPVESEVDRCTECGYCEPVCPSRDLTTTPRQRIALRRELASARARGDRATVRALERDGRYDVVQTCAVDGMCQTACPVGINTGDLVKRLRKEAVGGPVSRVAEAAADRWSLVTRTAATALDVAALLPPAVPAGVSRIGRALLGTEAVPRWDPGLPAGGSRRRPSPAARPDAVFLPSCQNALFAPTGTAVGAAGAVVALAGRAGVRLLAPVGIDAMCCGTPFSSKGLEEAHRELTGRTVPWLIEATEGGRLPAVSDAASCTEGWVRTTAGTPVHVVDAVAWATEVVLPRVPPSSRFRTVVLHPTCSAVRCGLDEAIVELAGVLADEVVVPPSWGCCGFAGDRGLLHPELTAAATTAQAEEVRAADADAHASVNRTCEIAMTRATGRPYVHILELLERVTR